MSTHLNEIGKVVVLVCFVIILCLAFIETGPLEKASRELPEEPAEQNIQVTPEPTTLLIVGTGLALVLRRRRP